MLFCNLAAICWLAIAIFDGKDNDAPIIIANVFIAGNLVISAIREKGQP